MGKGYFAIIASVIGATVAYKTYTGAWTPGKDPISVYVKEKQEALVKEWQEEQTKHALFMEQAAKDRVFLMNAPLNHTPVLRYQEYVAAAFSNCLRLWQLLIFIQRFQCRKPVEQGGRMAF